jgi:sec-independent protein translocase protein TatA
MLGGLTPGHLIVVLLVVVVLFGAARLPKLARSLGSVRNEFRKGAADPADTTVG